MITELKVRGWRCLRDVTVALTPIHALIGPNDSGKSTILEALLRGATAVVLSKGEGELEIEAESVRLHLRPGTEPVVVEDGGVSRWIAGDFIRRLGPVRRHRFDPDLLRSPGPLLPGPAFALEERGEGLPGVYDAILNRDREAWDAIERGVRAGFPTVKRLALKPVSTGEKILEVELVDGTRVDSSLMSEGLLYWLAFASLPHVSPAKLVLIEEPENGLHPARIAEVVRVLRAIFAQGTQVVLATHSPLVVNELEPEEVSVVTRTAAEGTKVRRVSTIPDLDRLRSVFSLGELWLAYANGTDEAGLFESKP